MFRFSNFVRTFIFSHNHNKMLKLGKHKIEFYDSIDSMPIDGETVIEEEKEEEIVVLDL